MFATHLPGRARPPVWFVALFCAAALGIGSCGGDDAVSPPIEPPNELGAMPDVPKPTSLNTEAQSETVTVVKPLLTTFAPWVYNAMADWAIRTQGCEEEFWIATCGGWSQTDYADQWMDALPAMSGQRPSTPFKVQLAAVNGDRIVPDPFYCRMNQLDYRRCGFLSCCLCWYNAEWSAPLPKLIDQPYLCRDRFWVVAGKSQILPPGFSQEITTTVTQGVEKTECDEWAASVSVEAEVTSGYATLKATIEASYSSTVTRTVYEEHTVETRYTPEPVPAGRQAVYQVWVLVDRYTLTDRSGRPYHDANYRFGPTKRVHVQGVWEAHAITYFPATAALSAPSTEPAAR